MVAQRLLSLIRREPDTPEGQFARDEENFFKALADCNTKFAKLSWLLDNHPRPLIGCYFTCHIIADRIAAIERDVAAGITLQNNRYPEFTTKLAAHTEILRKRIKELEQSKRNIFFNIYQMIRRQRQ